MKWKFVFLCVGSWAALTALLLWLLYINGMFRNGLINALPIGLSIVSFTAFMYSILLSVRPRKIEKDIGIMSLYKLHTVFAIIGLLTAAYHINARYNWGDPITTFAFITGMPSFILALTAVLTGIFVLSTIFVKYSASLTKLKETKFKRETGLWIHRLVIAGFILIYPHAIYFGFVRNNFWFAAVFTICFAGTLLVYYVYKLNILNLPKYKLTAVLNLTEDTYRIDMEPKEGELFLYRAGDFAFLRPVKTALPFEAHPFTMSSTPLDRRNVSMIIKEAGDFTNQISKLKVGDTVTLEGPYGNLFSEELEEKETPIVMLAGGIGIAPMVSIIHYLADTNSKRDIVLLWSASRHKDVFEEDYYNKLNCRFSNFKLNILLTKEKKDGYLHGRISHKQFEKMNMTHYYETADFIICGSTKMVGSMIDMLKEQKVNSARIHAEEFDF
ncbi:MAG: hypothetical protein LBE57_00240 [Methanosarcinales archaeon]|jgi:predicted ferric reductase|nr:hypothetical protein [Methanosarcinales archaeon]